MLLQWLRRRRRARISAEPFPAAWSRVLAENCFHYQDLSQSQQARLRTLVQIFVAEKNWEGCRGFEITDTVKVTTAAQACLLVLGLDEVYFDNVLSILMYPNSYVANNVEITRAGVMMEGGQPRLGEAWWRGPVILSWSDVLAGGRCETPGHNLVIHEFAHQLDMMNGHLVDGTPPMETKEQFQLWIDVLEPEYRKLVEDCRRGHRGLIDCYGATNVAEFFAVLTEAFFERPASLDRHHPEVYAILQRYFRLDPASWNTEKSPL
jgi:hypothetical protein